jgi:RNA polymerase sigma-70 factor (ECF subfamily)
VVALAGGRRSDADLVGELARGRTEALTEISRRHRDAVVALAARILHDHALAEDVVQDLLLRLWTEPHRFDARRGSLRTFLMRSASSRSIDVLRAESARRTRERRRARREQARRYDLEQEVLDRAVSAELRGALYQLSDDERHAVTLAYFGGHTYCEVAVLLGQPEGTVKSRIRVGLRRLRATLGTTPDLSHSGRSSRRG